MQMQYFRRLARSFAASFLLMTIGWLSAADTPKAALSGVVKGSDGKPLAGATVFVQTAAPKQGIGILCPSCYEDCRKRATTGTDGEYEIKELDSALTFGLLVAAPGHQPKQVSKVDPQNGPIETTLKAAYEGSAPNRRLRGRVVDSQGLPIAGALIEINGVTRDGRTQYGGNRDIDLMAVSDDQGLFVIRGALPFATTGLEIEARSFARAKFPSVASGDEIREFKLVEGVTVTGRVIKDGQPVGSVEIGLSGADRNSEYYIGSFTVATSPEGRFLFVNIPPSYAYQLYAHMKSLGDLGAVKSQTFRSGQDGTRLDLGDLEVKPAFVLAGQVRLADGKAVPEKTRVFLGRDNVADSQQGETDAAGHFRFTGVPAESISVSARVPGYRLSTRNASLDPLNRSSLLGTVVTNKTDLVIELEPGDRTTQRLPGDQSVVRQEPLRGVEASAKTGDIQVSGTVLDAESGQPLPQFTVVEGRLSNYSTREIAWMPRRKNIGTNGQFTIYFSNQRQLPAVMVEVAGYLPESSGPIPATGTNLVFKLRKGTGPTATVRQPNGKVAVGAAVYLTDMKDGVYLQERATVRMDSFPGTKFTRTDMVGRFSFEPLVDAFAIYVVDNAGFAEVRIGDLPSQPVIQLKPWARIEGRLLIGDKPGANESVRLWSANLPYEYYPRSFSPLHFYDNTKTDALGRFVFERVPPVAVEVYHEPKVKDERLGFTPMAQTTRMQLKGGVVNAVTLGGQGRPVIGRFVVMDYEGKIDWRLDVNSLELVVTDPPGLPSMLAISQDYATQMRGAKTDEEKARLRADYERRREEGLTKLKQYYQTEEGIRHHFSKKKYALNFKQDGSFRVEDVPAGKYSLNFEVREKSENRYSPMGGKLIASLKQEIEVPTIPGGHSDEPLDIGVIEVRARGNLKSGKTAPEFAVKTLDDKPLKLADFKGKYVLLDFWAVWCGPCVAETPHLKEAYELIKDNPKFAMVGLSLDPDKEAPIEYAKKNGIGWIQGFLGEWSKTDLPSQYGVDGIPSIMLIGPDGKIVASGLRGPAIKSALQGVINK